MSLEALPANIDHPEALAKAGVRFLGITSPLVFQQAALPAGWTIVDDLRHRRLQWLLDERRRKRARIFFKFDPWDSKAYAHVVSRYRVEYDWEREDRELVSVALVLDGDKKIYETEPLIPLELGFKYDVATAKAEAWLQIHFPRWRDPAAYWEEEEKMSLETHEELEARARGAYRAARVQNEKTGGTVSQSLEHTLVSALDFILASTLGDRTVAFMMDAEDPVGSADLVPWKALKALRQAKRVGAIDGMSVYSDMKIQELEVEWKRRGVGQ